MAIIARFSEHERYDINRDSNVVTFMATTSRGTFFAEMPLIGGASTLRDARKNFKDAAAQCISAGLEPGEISLA